VEKAKYAQHRDEGDEPVWREPTTFSFYEVIDRHQPE